MLEASCPVEQLIQSSRWSLPHGIAVLLGGMYGYHDYSYSPFYCRQRHWMGGIGRQSHWRRRSQYRWTRHECLPRDLSRTTETVTSSRKLMTDNLCALWKDWSPIAKIMIKYLKDERSIKKELNKRNTIEIYWPYPIANKLDTLKLLMQW
jgi:hypothetical protein